MSWHSQGQVLEQLWLGRDHDATQSGKLCAASDQVKLDHLDQPASVLDGHVTAVAGADAGKHLTESQGATVKTQRVMRLTG